MSGSFREGEALHSGLIISAAKSKPQHACTWSPNPSDRSWSPLRLHHCDLSLPKGHFTPLSLCFVFLFLIWHHMCGVCFLTPTVTQLSRQQLMDSNVIQLLSGGGIGSHQTIPTAGVPLLTAQLWVRGGTPPPWLHDLLELLTELRATLYSHLPVYYKGCYKGYRRTAGWRRSKGLGVGASVAVELGRPLPSPCSQVKKQLLCLQSVSVPFAALLFGPQSICSALQPCTWACISSKVILLMT